MALPPLVRSSDPYVALLDSYVELSIYYAYLTDLYVVLPVISYLCRLSDQCRLVRKNHPNHMHNILFFSLTCQILCRIVR